MPWVSAIISKMLLVGATPEELKEHVDDVARRSWPDINDSEDGSLHVGKQVEIPLDDWDSFMERSHYFITHPTKFEIPFRLLYPRERVLPMCPYCQGNGQYDPSKIDKEGC